MIVYNCQTVKIQNVQPACLSVLLMEISEQELESRLHSPTELLFAINWNEDKRELRIALFPKSVFPQYLSSFTPKMRNGYTYNNAIMTVFYGDLLSIDSKSLLPIDSSWVYLRPVPTEKRLEAGGIPLPPFLVEPTVYIFTFDDQCFKLQKKGIEYLLFE